MNYPTAGNSGPPGQGLNHAAPPSAGRAHPSQRGELLLSLGLSLPRLVALTTKFTQAAYPLMPTAPSEHIGFPGPLYRLHFGPSSCQISSAYFEGNLSLAAIQCLLLGVLCVRAIPELGALPQDSTPTTYFLIRQIRLRPLC